MLANWATHRITHGYESVSIPYPQLIGSPIDNHTLPIQIGCPWADLPMGQTVGLIPDPRFPPDLVQK